MIPKIIHYCWFGQNPIPRLEKKCIKSWSKYCKDFKIIKWDESNFDINSNDFTREAYKAKKWAFVADFVRLYALTTYGGIYLDTDIELLKPLDSLLNFKCFSGFEDKKLIAAGIMGCEKENRVFNMFYQYYFKFFSSSENKLPKMISIPTVITNISSSLGFEINNKFQEIDGFAIFPSEYFYPKDYGTGLISITKNTYSIHHYSASWFDSKRKRDLKKSWRRNRIKKLLITLFGDKFFNFIRRKKD